MSYGSQNAGAPSGGMSGLLSLIGGGNNGGGGQQAQQGGGLLAALQNNPQFQQMGQMNQLFAQGQPRYLPNAPGQANAGVQQPGAQGMNIMQLLQLLQRQRGMGM